jgi:hypothetical protein
VFGHRNRGPSGFFEISAPDAKTISGETRRCVHCGKHWPYRPGSGTTRGFCTRCSGLTCGSPACDPCVPYEVRIEIMEGSRSPTVLPYLDDWARVQAILKAMPQ